MQKLETDTPLILEESWVYQVSVLADLAARRVTAVVQEVSGLNLSQWRVIAAVADLPGRTATQVVDVTPMDKGIVSRAVAILVERGLLERQVSKQDGRLSHLFLTGEGKSAYTAIVAALDSTGASGRRSVSPNCQKTLVETVLAVINQYAQNSGQLDTTGDVVSV